MKFYKMATMIGGVIERNNTIEENRQVLSELLGKNEFVEPSYKDLKKLFTRLNAHNARELVKDMKSHEPDWHGKKVTNRLYGPIPGIPCGSWWGIRMDCSRDRMHDPFSASVQGGPVGAVSICTSHSNEDVDLGETLTFTGNSCTDEDKYFGKLVGEMEQCLGSSKSLVLNFKNQVPVRIIRSYDISNEYSPKTGYRYDGLYMVVHYWIGISPKTGLRCYKFALKRLFHQEPPPWKLKKPREGFESLTVSKQYSKNLSQGGTGTVSTKYNARINSNDTIISRCVSTKRFQTRDRNMLGGVKSSRKRRPMRQKDTSLELEAVQSTSRSQGTAITMLPVSPGRKIVSTDHRNVHVSAIVTRRVSKKLLNNSSMELKSLSESAVNKSWSFIGGTESQVIYNDGEDEGIKRSQNTRLQNTNISIRTDLYDSSHNLKYNSKKCGGNATHNTGIFKPRILGIPRRELNFAGVDSSPGSSRAISSVKMERVQSIDTQMTKRNSDHHLCHEKEKDKAVNLTADIVEIENGMRENQTKDIAGYRGSEPSDNLESRCTHSFEHSYASESPESLTHTKKCTDLVSEVINRKEYVEKGGDSSSGSSKDDGETDSCVTEVAQNYTTTLNNPESFRMEEKSLGRSFLPVTSPSQSPFKGFQCSERSRDTTESFLSESSVMMNSITFERMLDIITEDKSSPMAKRLINNVIGFPTVGSSAVFGDIMKTTTLRQPTRLDSREPEIPSTTQLSRENLWKWNRSRHSRPLENSRQQKIIEIVYDGEEEDLSQGATDNYRSSFTPEDKSSSISLSRKIEARDREVCLRLDENQESVEDQRPPEKKMRVLRTEDAVDFWNSESMGSVVGHCNVDENHKQARTKRKEDLNSSKTHYSIPETGDVPISDVLGLSKSLASQNTNQTLRTQPSAAPRIITRSKCLRNSIRGGNTDIETLDQVAADPNSGVNGDEDCNRNLKELQMGEKLVGNSSITLGLRSTGKLEQSDDKRNDKVPKNVPFGLKDENSFPNDTTSEENQRSKLGNGDRRLSKEKSKSAEKIRLIKRSGGKMKRKLEVANLFIDMNMSPRSQKLKAKSRSRRSLRGANHSRRRSCPAAVDRVMKRRSDDPTKHPTSSLKRMKKRVQVEAQSSSVQGAAKKGLSLRNRTKNGASPLRNDMSYKNKDLSDKSDSLKRIGKVKKAMNKITKPIKTNTRNLVVKKTTVNGLRAPAEISKKRENMTRTRSGINLRNLTIGRLGLRRTLLPGIETYGRKKKKKTEKQNQVQKQMVEKMQKQTSLSTKQSQPEKKELIEFALKKVKLDSNVYKETKTQRDTEKPKMVSVMTQCSLIPVPESCSAVIIGSYSNKTNVVSNLGSNAGYPRGSDSGSECICSSHNSPSDEIKNESIELIEIKSEVIDDDVANCDDGDDEEEIGGQMNTNSTSNQASTRLKEHKTSRASEQSNIKAPEVQIKSYTPYLKRFPLNFGAFGDQKSRDSVHRRGFLPYVAVRRVSAFVPVRSVESDLKMAQLKSIGFKPIKPGEFPQDGFEEGTEYGRRSTSDSPRIAYSSGVVKRGVNEEYDKYTSEETNVVQYMDSRLCYEDIENEDITVYGGYTKRASSNEMFSQKMEFIKFGGRDIDEESSGNSFLRGRDNYQDEVAEKEEKEEEVEDFEDNDEYEAEELEKDDIKDWQSQLDDSSISISEDNEQAVADSDGDVPWHGWKKITSNKETYFVGW